MKVLIKITSKLVFLILILNSMSWTACESKKNTDSSVQTTVAEPTPSPTLSVDKEAIEILRRSLNFLSSQEQFSVHAQSAFEDVLDSKYRIDYESSFLLLVKRPDKLRVERYGLELHQVVYYDGNTVTLSNPNENVYAIEAAPKSIEEMFHFIRDTFGLSGPSTDLIYKNSFSLMTEDVNGASVIGKEMIGDIMCDHLLVSRPDVSYQIWISDKEPFLPYKYVVTDITTPELLSYSTYMKNWNTSPSVSASMFKFTPNNESVKIPLLKSEQTTQH